MILRKVPLNQFFRLYIHQRIALFLERYSSDEIIGQAQVNHSKFNLHQEPDHYEIYSISNTKRANFPAIDSYLIGMPG